MSESTVTYICKHGREIEERMEGGRVVSRANCKSCAHALTRLRDKHKLDEMWDEERGVWRW